MKRSKLSSSKTKSDTTEYILKPFRPVRKARADLDRTDLSFCDRPCSEVVFEGRSFCLTGIFEFEDGDRNKCEDAVRARGGVCLQRPSHDLDYLVIGTYVEGSWAHKGYGRKIEAVLELRREQAKCKIVSEAQWLKTLQSTPEIPIEKRAVVGGQSRSHQLRLLQRELDELKKNQLLLARILKRELEPAVFSKLSAKLQSAGIFIS